jgi:hypothetical protein
MVVLADELLESFFDTDWAASFRLEPIVEAPLASPGGGLIGGLISSIVTDDNIKIFHKLTDEFGKTIGQHQVGIPTSGKHYILPLTAYKVTHRPSIGRVDRPVALEEPKARESLLTPGLRKSLSSTSLSTKARVQAPPAPLSTSSLTVPGPEQSAVKLSPITPGTMLAPMYERAAAVLERTPFAIDDPADDDDFTDDDDGAGVAHDVMDEVDAFLEENDSGLTDADKALQKGAPSDRILNAILIRCLDLLVASPIR